jgi:nucleotide-binding universal stress UspA family protein
MADEWKRFCCAIDFSEPSRLAMHAAAELARRFDGELELLHVHPPSPPAVEVLPSPPPVVEDFTEELRGTMAEWQEEAERTAGRPVRSTVVPGFPADEIARFAREHGIDLVVLGTHGWRGLRRLVLGSVAERATRVSPCPVLVVRRREQT